MAAASGSTCSLVYASEDGTVPRTPPAGAQPRFQSWGVQHVADAGVYFREGHSSRARKRKSIRGSEGFAPSGVKGRSPPEADDISS